MSVLAESEKAEQVRALLESVANSLVDLKALLEANNILDLESALKRLQDTLNRLTSLGGLDGLISTIKALPEADRNDCEMLLKTVSENQEIISGLIRLAMQRNLALQAYSAQTNPGATYSSGGGIDINPKGDLLGKY